MPILTDYDITTSSDREDWSVEITPSRHQLRSAMLAFLEAAGIRGQVWTAVMSTMDRDAACDALRDHFAVTLPGDTEVVNADGKHARLFTHHGMTGGSLEPVAEDPLCDASWCPNHAETGSIVCADHAGGQAREDAAEIRAMQR